MNKTKFLRVTLLVIPLLVVLLAVRPDSVTIVGESGVSTASFLTLVEISSVGWCAPVAALMNYGLFAAAVLLCLLKKEIWLKISFGLSFVAMCIAVLPIVVNSSPKIVPNVFVAILLGGQCLASRKLMKPVKEPPKAEGKRLKLR